MERRKKPKTESIGRGENILWNVVKYHDFFDEYANSPTRTGKHWRWEK
jgi:hypothetical protein